MIKGFAKLNPKILLSLCHLVNTTSLLDSLYFFYFFLRYSLLDSLVVLGIYINVFFLYIMLICIKYKLRYAQ